MPSRARKRKTCSCCEVPSQSSVKENTTKRRRVGNKCLSTTEPILGNVVTQPPVNKSSQIVPSMVFSPELEESNEDIVFESEGHSTRRTKSRRCQTIRGREFVHTFIKEVTYTVASTRLGYVGQELLPFQKRHNFFQKSSPSVPKVDASDTQSLRSDSGSDDFVTNFPKAFEDDNDFNDSDSSFGVDSDHDDSVWSFEKSSVDDDAFKDSDGESVWSFERAPVDDEESKRDTTPFDDDNDAYSVGSFEKSRDDDDSIDTDSLPDIESYADSAKKFGKPTVDDNDSVHNDSSESGDEPGCFSKFGVRCQWHNKIKKHCSCKRRLPCDYDSRPEPAPCPKELENLEEVVQSGSNEKREYAILQDVNLGYEDCSPCVYLYSNELLTICNRQHSSLRIDRTFNLGHCYVTMFAFRNGNFIDSSSKSEYRQYGPLMTGPVMIHFDKSLSTYLRFFNTIRDRCGITNEPMTPDPIDEMMMRRMPKKDRMITAAMRQSFGTNMSLCSNNTVPTTLRTSLKREVNCYSPLEEVVKVVHTKMSDERYETSRAIFGIRSVWRLTARAKMYLEQWALQSRAVQLEALDKLSPEY